MSYSTTEVKSGFLVILSLILLLVLTFIVGGFMRGETQEWQIQFSYIGGIEENAPVYYSGREVGKIEKIEVLSSEVRPILVTASLRSDIKPRQDSQAFVDMLGMMGQKILEVTPGTEETPLLKRGEIISGTDPIPMHVLITKMNLLADRMDDLTTSLNPFMVRANRMLARHEEEIARIVGNLEQISSNVRDMTTDLKYRPWRLLRKGKVDFEDVKE